VSSNEASVTSQEPIRADRGMSRDEEVGYENASPPSALSISSPCLSCEEGGFRVTRIERNLQFGHRGIEGGPRLELSADFRPDDIASDQRSLRLRSMNRFSRRGAELY